MIRAAIAYEKKTRAINLEQEKVLEKNMNLVIREIEKLRGEFANAEKRARAAAAAANPSNLLLCLPNATYLKFCEI